MGSFQALCLEGPKLLSRPKLAGRSLSTPELQPSQVCSQAVRKLNLGLNTTSYFFVVCLSNQRKSSKGPASSDEGF